MFSLGLLLAVGLAWTQRQGIYDWYRLRGYDPPKVVAELARDTTMNNSARKLFYVNHPDIEGKDEFNQHCPQTEQTIVLGCYVQNRGIYIYDVTDKRLEGIEEVTAAHELLHAAYDRLGGDERNSVIGMLQKTYAQLKDTRIRKNVASYKKAGADIYDELHSILGTEVRNLPTELENYYKKYFNNRTLVVKYSEKYEIIFTDLKEKAKEIENQINALKQNIKSLENSLSIERASLEKDRSKVKTQAQVDAYNQKISVYNSSVSYLNELVSRHNDLVKQHQKLVVQQQAYKAINSSANTL